MHYFPWDAFELRLRYGDLIYWVFFLDKENDDDNGGALLNIFGSKGQPAVKDCNVEDDQGDQTDDMFGELDEWGEDLELVDEDLNASSSLTSQPPPPLVASYNRHKIVQIDDTVHNQLILVLEDWARPDITRLVEGDSM